MHMRKLLPLRLLCYHCMSDDDISFRPTANGMLVSSTTNVAQEGIGSASSNGPGPHSANTSPKSAWRAMNDTPATREAVKKISELGEKYGVSLLSASLRWLAYHSRLESSDGIILGAGNWRDLEERVGDIAKGPLPEEMVKTMEDIGEELAFSRVLQ
jgi:aryl-alcohol dehydrogenase-like predicted oxidoreductase